MKKSIKYILSLTPVVFLILFLAIVIRIYGIDALSGPSQLVLITSTGIAVLVAMLYFHQPWKTLEEEINHSIGSIGSPICILLLIGLLSGTWMVSGVVPMLIYYGMQIISPHVFLVSACAISAIVSVMTGSSWTTVATLVWHSWVLAKPKASATDGRQELFSQALILAIRCRHSPTPLCLPPPSVMCRSSHILNI